MEQSISIALRALEHAVSRKAEMIIGDRGSYALSSTHIWVLAFLAQHQEQDIYQKDLEAHFGFTRSTASKLVNRLEERNLVQRHPVPHDARLKKLILTDDARKLIEELTIRSREFEAVLTAGFTTEEKAQIKRYLERLKNNLK